MLQLRCIIVTKYLKKIGVSDINNRFEKVILLTLVSVCLFFIASVKDASAASRYWVGDTDGAVWNDTAHWSTAVNSCGVSGGASVPGSLDVAYFVSNCTNGASMNVDVNVAGINIASGSGVVSPASAITITVGTTGFVQAGGTFMTTEGTLTLTGPFTKTGGTFNQGTGTVTIAGGSTVYSSDSTQTFHNFFISKGSNSNSFVITAGQTIIVTGTLTITNGVVNTGTIDARGNIVQTASDGGTAIIDFGNNSLAQTYSINTSGGVGPILRYDNAADADDTIVLMRDSSGRGPIQRVKLKTVLERAGIYTDGEL